MRSLSGLHSERSSSMGKAKHVQLFLCDCSPPSASYTPFMYWPRSVGKKVKLSLKINHESELWEQTSCEYQQIWNYCEAVPSVKAAKLVRTSDSAFIAQSHKKTCITTISSDNSQQRTVFLYCHLCHMQHQYMHKKIKHTLQQWPLTSFYVCAKEGYLLLIN